jgi:phage-related protein (TIGR01555 family)
MANPLEIAPSATAAQMTRDTLQNLTTGMGTGRDSSVFNRHVLAEFISRDEADALYLNDWLGAACVDAKPDDAVREWRTVSGIEGADLVSFDAAQESFGVKSMICQAMKWASLYGGAGIVMGIDGAGEMHEPLDLSRVKSGSLKWMTVIDRWHLLPSSVNFINPMRADFGKPELYHAYQGPDQIHRSRILFFYGTPLPFHLATRSHFWGASILERVKDAVENAGVAQTGVAQLVTEAKVDVFKIPNLFDMLKTPEGTSIVMERLRLSNLGKGLYNSILMDSQEDYEQKTGALSSGISDVVLQFLEIVAGAAGIPVTRLLGTSPAGLGSTGEENTRNYYDHVKTMQEDAIGPALKILDEVMLRSTIGDVPAEFDYEFNSLWQQSETERATTQAQDQVRDSGYMLDGVVEPHHVAERLRQTNIYPTLDEAHVAELQGMQDLLPQPPVDSGQGAPAPLRAGLPSAGASIPEN